MKNETPRQLHSDLLTDSVAVKKKKKDESVSRFIGKEPLYQFRKNLCCSRAVDQEETSAKQLDM